MSSDVLIERLFELLICGDRRGASRLVDTALRDGLTLEDLAQEAYGPLIRMINALHRAEQLTNLAYGCATQILTSLVDDAQQRGVDPPDHRGSRFAPADDHAEPLPAPRRWACDFAEGIARPRPDRSAGSASSRSQFVEFSVKEGVLKAKLAGPCIGSRETPIVNTEINDILDALGPRIRRLVLDLTDVQVMSSMALGMCLDLRTRARSLGAPTTAVGLTGEMNRVFRRLKIGRADRRESRRPWVFRRALSAA